jgi:hypothetical protein
MKAIAYALLFAAFAHYLCLWVKMPSNCDSWLFLLFLILAWFLCQDGIDRAK